MASSDFNFTNRKEFEEASQRLSYRDVQTYAKALGVDGLRAKRTVLEEKISDALDRLDVAFSTPEKAPPRPAKSPPPLSKQTMPDAGTSAREKVPPRPAKSPPPLSKRTMPDAGTSSAREKVPPRPVGRKFHEVLYASFSTGDPEPLRSYIAAHSPSPGDLEAAINKVQIESVSMMIPIVVDVILDHYSPVRLSSRILVKTPEGVPAMINKLAKFLFAVSLDDDNSVAMKLGIRILTEVPRNSTMLWTRVISEAMRTGAIRCFEMAVAFGLLRMDQYRGPVGQGSGMIALRDAMAASGLERDKMRLFVLLIEEMILNDEVSYYTIDEFDRLSAKLL